LTGYHSPLDSTSTLVLDAPLAALAPTLTHLTDLAARCDLASRRYLLTIDFGASGGGAVPRVLLLFQHDATPTDVLGGLLHARRVRELLADPSLARLTDAAAGELVQTAGRWAEGAFPAWLEALNTQGWNTRHLFVEEEECRFTLAPMSFS
jgi:hypothetical protein